VPWAAEDARAPLLTLALAAALALVFALELAVGERSGHLSLQVESLVSLGALDHGLVSAPGQWYRLVAAGLLHAGPLHLALNVLALAMGGSFLEREVGRAWLLVLFTLSLLSGSLTSLAVNGPAVVSVGASGAIMGLLAAALVLTLHLPGGARRVSSQLVLAAWLVPALLPLVGPGRGGLRVDLALHLGGAAAGAALGAAILAAWRPGTPLPPGRGLARALAAGCAIVLFAGAGLAAAGERRHARGLELQALLAPADALEGLGALPPDAAALAARGLAARYPRDPRLLLTTGLLDALGGDPAAGEAGLRAALAERELLGALFPDGRLEAAARVHLAGLLLARGAGAEAGEVVRPACATAADVAPGVLPPDVLARLCRG
jgi:rhomboid protease GluP